MNTIDSNTPSAKRWLIVIAVMSATLMQVLDTTIVNVALPHIQGELNAAPNQISWTLTCYLIASAIIMPLAGYFSDRLGRKNYLLWCIAGFTFASALCGMANSFPQIIAFRLLQGLFGAALVPLSQATLIDIYPPKELGKAMAIFGTGVMVGPILGPTLGGYLTDIASWRWAFYINIPIGIMSFLLSWKVVPNTIKKKRSFDWLGFFFLTITIGAIQYFLDRGNQDDWFNANSIRLAAFFAISGFISFLIYSYFNRGQSIFDLSIFKNRNFTISSLLLLALGIGLFGSIAILPMFLESLLNYPVFITGLTMTPRAISVMFSMIVVGKLCQRIDQRKIVAIGILISAIGTYVCTYYTLEINKWWLIWPLILQGLGLGMLFVPLSTLAFSTLPEKSRVEAASLNSLLRTIGASIGIAVIFNVYTSNTQTSWNHLISFISPYNPNLMEYLQPLHLQITDPIIAPLLSGEVTKQAMMLSTVNVFGFIMLSLLAMLPFILLLKRPKHTEKQLPKERLISD
ncbi:MAG: DHA2 family efflux MFS transporter permease subunit [Gammaproteobacteria bacterium]|nr:DHA2 family efflux MFS transporter permease subunit [Gammaproteobacteria bacterium]